MAKRHIARPNRKDIMGDCVLAPHENPPFSAFGLNSTHHMKVAGDDQRYTLELWPDALI